MALLRKKEHMPSFVREAMEKADVVKDYKARPAYQQNDYLSWIKRAKLDSTKQKRLKQMIAELKKGGVYMKMKHNASKK